ncbi:MAG TPA: rRNA maturation RNase YbeY, partial [Flavobacteriales bacterium]|nr:rRNA maturation RNase YbeY [Flavobacteriales bacterium]
MNNKIGFHYETDFLLENTESFIRWIKNIISEENKKLGDLNYIFCDDKYLLEKNIKYLDHDTLTDIITFSYCEGDVISSDIMISVERVMENSSIFENSFLEELNRVMVHGILHLVGYNDKTKEE